MAFAAACGALWLALPMSFLFGSMCNPESATLFFMLLTFVLHDRLRAAPWPLYALPVASHFAAAQMDWQAHFAVPAIFVWELARRREGGPKIARVFVLGLASLAAAFTVVVLFGFFVDTALRAYALLKAGAGGELPAFEVALAARYFSTGFHDAITTSAGSAAASPSFADWAAWQRENVATFFTWPAALLVAAGAALALVRRTPALVLGLVLLLPGLLNVVVFRSHAKHEFWLWYATPGVAVVIAEVLRPSSGGRCSWASASRPSSHAPPGASTMSSPMAHDRPPGRGPRARRAGRAPGRRPRRRSPLRHRDVLHAPLGPGPRARAGTLQELHDVKMAGRISNPLVFLVAGKPDGASSETVMRPSGRSERSGGSSPGRSRPTTRSARGRSRPAPGGWSAWNDGRLSTIRRPVM